MSVKSRAAAPAEQTFPFAQNTSIKGKLGGPGQLSLKSMILRLEASLGRSDLADRLILVSRKKHPPQDISLGAKTDQQTIGFVVGFCGSAHSQTALDLALCMAHQTRLIKPNPVVVHVVYVVERARPKTIANADRILWQARCLASEWRGSLNAHLRVGDVAQELSQVAADVNAEVMVVGCPTTKDRLVPRLAEHTPCSILGVPN